MELIVGATFCAAGGVCIDSSEPPPPLQPAASAAVPSAIAIFVDVSFMARPPLPRPERRAHRPDRAGDRRGEIWELVVEVGRTDRRTVRDRLIADRRVRRRAQAELQMAERTHGNAQLDVDDVVARAPAIREAGKIAPGNAERA